MSERIPELWASREVCDSLGWTRERLQRAKREGFPEPVQVVAGGAIALWVADEVRAWYAAQDPRRTRKWRREEAVRMYRRGKSIAEIGRSLGAKGDSIRVWLRSAGETLPRERAAETHSL
jgi:hypothetical protein